MKDVAAYGWPASLYSVPWCMVVDNLMVEAARLVENPESGESLKKGIEDEGLPGQRLVACCLGRRSRPTITPAPARRG